VICAGTSSEIVFWDLRKLKPLAVFDESHSDDVTKLAFHSKNKDWLLSCSTDGQLCHFDFRGKQALTEDEVVEGVYCSQQPLIDCGFIGDKQFWTLTSINTVEICSIETACLEGSIKQFPNNVEYIIGANYDENS